MPDLEDGASIEMKGSAAKPYVLKNTGGVYSCDCPAWRNQSVAIEQRTCKHLRKLRGDAAEDARIRGGAPATSAPGQAATAKSTSDAEVGDESKAPPLLLAHVWETDVDLTGWWMSEKLDGVRAYWTGKQFLSRLGNVYHAPDWFTEGLPDVPLDGELWCGRKKFQRCVSIARRQDKSAEWRELTYVVFDAPAMDAPFEDRLAFVQQHMDSTIPRHARHHAHARCEGTQHLKAELARVEALGGEGLMLRKPGSSYEVGRSSTLLKVKSFQDAEARVVEHIAGAGRHAGRLGALGVEMADGTRFSIGTGFSDAERKSPPPIGAVVTFRYQELSNAGVPRFPSYVGIRDDVAFVPARKAAAPVPAPSPAPAGSSKKRRFELSDGSANKFWEVEVHGVEQIVRFGRIGTAGQTKTKSFSDEAAARAASDALVAEKVAKGYVESP
jgi:DNA ligase-1